MNTRLQIAVQIFVCLLQCLNLLYDWLAIRIGSNALFSIATVFSRKITKHCLKHLVEDLDYYRAPAFASGPALINCPGVTLFE